MFNDLYSLYYVIFLVQDLPVFWARATISLSNTKLLLSYQLRLHRSTITFLLYRVSSLLWTFRLFVPVCDCFSNHVYGLWNDYNIILWNDKHIGSTLHFYNDIPTKRFLTGTRRNLQQWTGFSFPLILFYSFTKTSSLYKFFTTDCLSHWEKISVFTSFCFWKFECELQIYRKFDFC